MPLCMCKSLYICVLGSEDKLQCISWFYNIVNGWLWSVSWNMTNVRPFFVQYPLFSFNCIYTQLMPLLQFIHIIISCVMRRPKNRGVLYVMVWHSPYVNYVRNSPTCHKNGGDVSLAYLNSQFSAILVSYGTKNYQIHTSVITCSLNAMSVQCFLQDGKESHPCYCN